MLTRAKLKEQGLAQSSINHRLVTLSVLFKTAAARGGCQGKPALGMKRVKRGRIRWVSETEEKVMLKLLDQWGKADAKDHLIVLMDTGMRPGESLRLAARDCEFKSGMLQVWESKTEAGVRGLPMTKRVKEILERRCMDKPSGPSSPARGQSS
jgi:integrase